MVESLNEMVDVIGCLVDVTDVVEIVFFSFLYWAKPSCRHSTPRRLLRARASDSAG